jgi:hypothetical protein
MDADLHSLFLKAPTQKLGGSRGMTQIHFFANLSLQSMSVVPPPSLAPLRWWIFFASESR